MPVRNFPEKPGKDGGFFALATGRPCDFTQYALLHAAQPGLSAWTRRPREGHYAELAALKQLGVEEDAVVPDDDLMARNPGASGEAPKATDKSTLPFSQTEAT